MNVSHFSLITSKQNITPQCNSSINIKQVTMVRINCNISAYSIMYLAFNNYKLLTAVTRT